MNTPAHLLTGAALFGRKGGTGRLWAATFGSLLPDLSLYLLVFWALGIAQISPEVVFDELYFSPSWQQVFAIDNSIPLWSILFAVALRYKSDWAIALCSAALVHIGLDFLMHAGDGRPNFWPFSDWVFHSPISYWDSRHHADWVSPVTLLASGIAFVVLWRHCGWRGRVVFSGLIGAEFWTAWQMFNHF